MLMACIYLNKFVLVYTPLSVMLGCVLAVSEVSGFGEVSFGAANILHVYLCHLVLGLSACLMFLGYRAKSFTDTHSYSPLLGSWNYNARYRNTICLIALQRPQIETRLTGRRENKCSLKE